MADDEPAGLTEVGRNAYWRRIAALRARAKLPCDYCEAGVPRVDGWHIVHDDEGIEGDARIPCPRVSQ